MRRIGILVVPLLGVACTRTASGPAPGANPACASGKVDLSKVSGDWISAAPIKDSDGKVYPPNQYRIRFLAAPGADGSVKAILAWRLDSRPFSGTLTQNALGGSMDLVEDMKPETIEQLKKSNNQDPHLPMRAAVQVAPDENGCALSVTDNFQTFVGEKVITNAGLGVLRLVPAAGTPALSWNRCEAPKAVYFDGKADGPAGPPTVPSGRPVAVKVEADRTQYPKDCNFDSDVYLDGALVASRVPAKADPKEIVFESSVTFPVGAVHGVQVDTFSVCGQQRKFERAACNFALPQ